MNIGMTVETPHTYRRQRVAVNFRHDSVPSRGGPEELISNRLRLLVGRGRAVSKVLVETWVYRPTGGAVFWLSALLSAKGKDAFEEAHGERVVV